MFSRVLCLDAEWAPTDDYPGRYAGPHIRLSQHGRHRSKAGRFLKIRGRETLQTDILCKALIIAKNESELYPNIRESVSAILFLGTPHQGSPTADYASILSQIANIFVIGIQASRYTGPIRTDLLKSLRANEKELVRIAEDFRVHTATIKITSFIEQKTMQGLNERVCSHVKSHEIYTDRR